MSTIKLPNQPLCKDEGGVVRFLKNPIVEHLLDSGGLDLNYLAMWCFEHNIDKEYEAQFAQLIGYSLDGWGTLSYVSDEKWGSVEEDDK